jgi:hypothetical protein
MTRRWTWWYLLSISFVGQAVQQRPEQKGVVFTLHGSVDRSP